MRALDDAAGTLFAREKAAAFKIAAAPLAKMRSFRQRRWCDQEAGGVLLGRYIIDAPDIVVDEVTTPMWGDQRSRTAFRRGRRPHQRVIDGRWKQTQGTCQYLGEWHTHPERVPHPSPVDLADWRRRLREDVVDADSLFFVVLGTEALCVWEGFRSKGLLVPLRAVGSKVRT